MELELLNATSAVVFRDFNGFMVAYFTEALYSQCLKETERGSYALQAQMMHAAKHDEEADLYFAKSANHFDRIMTFYSVEMDESSRDDDRIRDSCNTVQKALA